MAPTFKLFALANAEIQSQLAVECVQALLTLADRNRISIRWIKGPAGHVGNDAADATAKAGAQQLVEGPEPLSWLPRASQKLIRVQTR